MPSRYHTVKYRIWTYKLVTNYYGRHWFTTYWEVHRDINSELIGYMRGDKAGSSVEDHGAMHHYIHTYYEDIRDIYLEKIFKLES